MASVPEPGDPQGKEGQVVCSDGAEQTQGGPQGDGPPGGGGGGSDVKGLAWRREREREVSGESETETERPRERQISGGRKKERKKEREIYREGGRETAPMSERLQARDREMNRVLLRRERAFDAIFNHILN